MARVVARDGELRLELREGAIKFAANGAEFRGADDADRVGVLAAHLARLAGAWGGDLRVRVRARARAPEGAMTPLQLGQARALSLRRAQTVVSALGDAGCDPEWLAASSDNPAPSPAVDVVLLCDDAAGLEKAAARLFAGAATPTRGLETAVATAEAEGVAPDDPDLVRARAALEHLRTFSAPQTSPVRRPRALGPPSPVVSPRHAGRRRRPRRGPTETAEEPAAPAAPRAPARPRRHTAGHVALPAGFAPPEPPGDPAWASHDALRSKVRATRDSYAASLARIQRAAAEPAAPPKDLRGLVCVLDGGRPLASADRRRDAVAGERPRRDRRAGAAAGLAPRAASHPDRRRGELAGTTPRASRRSDAVAAAPATPRGGRRDDAVAAAPGGFSPLSSAGRRSLSLGSSADGSL